MAHSYSTDSPERHYVPFVVATAAIATAFLVHGVITRYSEVPWWAPPIDTMAFYGVYYWLFDKWVWQWRIVRRTGFVKIPVLSGEWKGRIEPSITSGVSAGLGLPIDIAIVIHQSWTSMLIVGRTHQSLSRSLSASIIVTDECSISYEYLNEPVAPAPKTMHTHRGTAHVTLDRRGTLLRGEYYSGRDRQNVGTIHIERNS
jgi:predicted pore-forming effector associated with SMODS systems